MQTMNKMYDGDSDAAMLAFRQLQRRDPRNPLGYILEAEARWWKIYCSASTVKWGMVDAWKRGKLPADGEYLALLDREIALTTGRENATTEAPANNSAAAPESAEMHLYAGIGLALKARMYALQGDNHATAHAAVAARREFLRTVQMNPTLADAYTGLGLYNYYVDTLGPIVKMLRFLMGIPGGNRKLGILQLERGMKDGQLTAVEARFYLATSLRTYDHDYQRALTIAQPLAARYPGNPIFLLVIGNLQQELGDHAAAADTFHAAENAPIHDSACAARVHQLVSEMPSPPR
jgi:tetratricopeptide (TPR) repeat protein